MTTPQRTLPCQEAGPEAFYGPADSGPGARLFAWEWMALEYCCSCPVEAACLAEALSWPAKDQFGVVGGMTAGQRIATLLDPKRRPAQTTATEAEVDPLTVEHLIAGVAVPGASRLEMAHAAVRLHDSGMDCTQVAVRLHVLDRQVKHWIDRHEEGLPMVADAERRAS